LERIWAPTTPALPIRVRQLKTPCRMADAAAPFQAFCPLKAPCRPHASLAHCPLPLGPGVHYRFGGFPPPRAIVDHTDFRRPTGFLGNSAEADVAALGPMRMSQETWGDAPIPESRPDVPRTTGSWMLPLHLASNHRRATQRGTRNDSSRITVRVPWAGRRGREAASQSVETAQLELTRPESTHVESMDGRWRRWPGTWNSPSNHPSRLMDEDSRLAEAYSRFIHGAMAEEEGAQAPSSP
jgi:hypothetical protein